MRNIALLTLAVFLTACSHTYRLTESSPGRFYQNTNQAAKKKEAQIELVNHEIFKGKGIYVTEDSTSWLDADTGVQRTVATSSIKKISITKRNAGKGFLFGFLTGAAAGITMGLAQGESDCSEAIGDGFCLEKDDAAAFGAVVLGVPSGLVGLVAGAATKTTDSYEFQQIEF